MSVKMKRIILVPLLYLLVILANTILIMLIFSIEYEPALLFALAGAFTVDKAVRVLHDETGDTGT